MACSLHRALHPHEMLVMRMNWSLDATQLPMKPLAPIFVLPLSWLLLFAVAAVIICQLNAFQTKLQKKKNFTNFYMDYK